MLYLTELQTIFACQLINKHVKCKAQFIRILGCLEVLDALCKHILPEENVTRLISSNLYLVRYAHFNVRRIAGEVHIGIQ